MRDSNVGKVRVDGFYNLVIVVPELLKLEIKVVKPCDELHLRRVAFDDDELFGEDAFDDKSAAVMLQSRLTKHLLKADILFRGEFEIIPVNPGVCCCRTSDPLFRGCHQSGSLSGVTRERHPASQSEHLCMPKNFSAYKGTARSRQATGTVPAFAEGNSSLEKASPKQKIMGRFSAAILRGSSGIKKRGCRPCEASGGHREPTSKNRITLRADGFKPTHDGMYIRWRRDFSK